MCKATRSPSRVTGDGAQGRVLRLTPRAEANLVGIGRNDFLGRPDMQLAAFGVDNRGVARLDCVERAFDPGQRGNAERPRNDRDVARGAALLEHQPAQALPVVVEQLGRSHGAGDDD